MSSDHVSYVPNGSGRFVRYSYARPTGSSNRFVELGRFFFNLIRGILQLFNLLHYSLTTLNNMLSSLPFCIRYIVHAIFSICFPFYTIYQGYIILSSRIHRIVYPIYRAVTLLTRLVTFFITLPLRIITFITTKTQTLLKSLLIIAIIAAVSIGIITLFLDEYQLDYFKSYVRNTTDILLKYSSVI